MRPLLFALLGLLLLASCARDREAAVRAALDQWFFLGETEHFRATRFCTGAVFDLSAPVARPDLTVDVTLDGAQLHLRTTGMAAIRVAHLSGHQVVEGLLRSNAGDFGREALAAAIEARTCYERTAHGAGLAAALTRPGATLLYNADLDGLAVLDPRFGKLYFIRSLPVGGF